MIENAILDLCSQVSGSHLYIIAVSTHRRSHSVLIHTRLCFSPVSVHAVFNENRKITRLFWDKSGFWGMPQNPCTDELYLLHFKVHHLQLKVTVFDLCIVCVHFGHPETSMAWAYFMAWWLCPAELSTGTVMVWSCTDPHGHREPHGAVGSGLRMFNFLSF